MWKLPAIGLFASAMRKLTPRIPFSRAFHFAVLMASGSLSSAATSPAPNRRPASARIPEPVPASNMRHPFPRRRVTLSSKRSDIAVVACSPVPNAVPAGITSLVESEYSSASLATISRFPTRSGFVRCAENHCASQSSGNRRVDPPNFFLRAFAIGRLAQKSSTRSRARFGFSTTAWVLPVACCKAMSCVLSHVAVANFSQM